MKKYIIKKSLPLLLLVANTSTWSLFGVNVLASEVSHQKVGQDPCKSSLCVESEFQSDVNNVKLNPLLTGEPYNYDEITLSGFKEQTMKSLKSAEELISSGQPEKEMVLTLIFRDEKFNYDEIRLARKNSSPEDRALTMQNIIDIRENQLSAKRQLVKSQVNNLGGKVLRNYITSANFEIQIPAKSLKKLKSALEPLAITQQVALVHETADGLERRHAVGIYESVGYGEMQELSNYGYTGAMYGTTRGSLAGSSVQRVRIGIIEASPLNICHESFRTGSGGSSDYKNCLANPYPYRRIKKSYVCSVSQTPNCRSGGTGTSASHATSIASIILGDLTDEQNSSETVISNQIRKSGIAPEAYGYFYQVGNYNKRENVVFANDVATAIEQAVFKDFVDIINISMSDSSPRLGYNNYCTTVWDYSYRKAVEAAEDAGVLIVMSADNDGAAVNGCSVSGMASHADILTVGALEDVNVLAKLSDTALAATSSRGERSVSIENGYSSNIRPVDLTATGTAKMLASSNESGYNKNDEVGTSVSAPIVTGLAALLKEQLELNGEENWSSYAYGIRVLLSLMGDGASTINGGGSGYGFTVSKDFGFGKIRYVDFFNELGSDGKVEGHYMELREGETREYNIHTSAREKSTLKGWKFVALIDDENYSYLPEVTIKLIDVCPSNGNSEQVIRTASKSSALKFRMRMKESEMASLFHNRCLKLRFTVDDIREPYGDTLVKIWAADYFYSNDRFHHDIDN